MAKYWQYNFIAWLTPLALAVSVSAQEERAPEVPEKRQRVIEEIVVTSTRRAREVRDIPTSIDAFTGENLERRGATTIEEIVKYSPGVTLEGGISRSASTVQIRGITSDARGRAGRSVGRFYGEVPLVNPSVMGFEPDIDPFDMETVEILKGPQGTLFGGSALAGAVRFVPNKPDFDEFYGSASYSTGTIATSDEMNHEYTLMLNLPLHRTLAARLAGSRRDLGGYIDDVRREKEDVNDYQGEQWRAILGWKPLENVALHVSYTSIEGEQGSLDFFPGHTGREARKKRRHDLRFVDEFEFTDSEIVGLQLSWDLPLFAIILESNRMEKSQHQRADVTWLLALEDTSVRIKLDQLPFTVQTTHEMRVVSNELSNGWWPFRDWEYTVGLFYMKSDQLAFARTQVFSTSPESLELLPDVLREQLEQGTHTTKNDIAFALARETALYFNLTRFFGDRWELNLGGRWFNQVTDGGADSFLTNDSALVPTQPTELAEPFRAKPEESGFNPKVALTWQPTDHIAVLASVAKGFRFGGVNLRGIEGVTDVPPDFESDELTNYELSFRTSWLDRQITADMTLFRIDWNNMQIQQRDPESGLFTFTQNVGKSTVDGVEFAVNSILPGGFSVIVNGAHVDSQTATGFESNQFGHIDSGTRLQQSPRWTWGAALQYNEQWFGWDVYGSVGYSYRGDSKNDLVNSYPLEGYGTYSMSLSAGNMALPLEPRISFIATNLTNRTAMNSAFVPPSGHPYVILTTPRQLSLKIEGRF